MAVARDRRRRLLALLIAGPLTLAVAGGGGFAAGLGAADPRTDLCDEGRERCFLTVDQDQIRNALLARGFECADDYPSDCRLSVGRNEFVLTTFVRDGLVDGYGTSIYYPEGGPLPRRAAPMLGWAAAIPFPHDPELRVEAQQWLEEHLPSGGQASTHIGGHAFMLDHYSNPSGRATLWFGVDGGDSLW